MPGTKQKLKDPRIFDVGRVKRPEELLKMPNFHFSDKDVESISSVLVSMVKDPVPLEMRDKTTQAIAEGRQLIAEKNCRGCHSSKASAAISVRPRNKRSGRQTSNTEGFKTQPLWLHPFLKDPGTVKLRPWLTARMPTFHFTEQQAGTIERYFSALDKVDYPFINTDIDTTPERLKVGAELFTKLQCQSCHPTSNAIPPGKAPEDLAPNLQLAHRAPASGLGAAVAGGSAEDLPGNENAELLPARREGRAGQSVPGHPWRRRESTDPGHSRPPVRHRRWRPSRL